MTQHEKIVSEELMVDLTPEELTEYGDQLTRSLIELEELKEEKRSVTKGYQKRLEELERRVMRLAHVTVRRRELRTVSVKLLMDYNTQTVGYMRLDTGELYHKRAMTADERQLCLIESDDDRVSESA